MGIAVEVRLEAKVCPQGKTLQIVERRELRSMSNSGS
jgi:hypothetical protein